MARPTKLTPEVQRRLCDVVRAGNYREAAAQVVGVTPRTLTDWCRRGRSQKAGIYAEFLRALLEAEAEAETKAVELVLKAAAQEPRHAQWWLERKFPERWGRDTLLASELRRLVRELEKKKRGGRTAPAG